ncbi:protein of unknown function [Bradyrhizobium vignae]|uniref:Uncharacterized protein n=1 Tax=Bradyrhizobium vignae TaxID=1549949 RepID=A0A2U3Q8I3_9BRAD|nr:protein of unknown function [Bradyrhizobium vignae]
MQELRVGWIKRDNLSLYPARDSILLYDALNWTAIGGINASYNMKNSYLSTKHACITLQGLRWRRLVRDQRNATGSR